MEKEIRWNVVRAGQPRPYADTVNEYLIESNCHERHVESFCTKFLDPAKHERSNIRHDGSCNFPTGLEAFYSFTKISDGKYRYIVTHPFTG